MSEKEPEGFVGFVQWGGKSKHDLEEPGACFISNSHFSVEVPITGICNWLIEKVHTVFGFLLVNQSKTKESREGVQECGGEDFEILVPCHQYC